MDELARSARNAGVFESRSLKRPSQNTTEGLTYHLHEIEIADNSLASPEHHVNPCRFQLSNDRAHCDVPSRPPSLAPCRELNVMGPNEQ